MAAPPGTALATRHGLTEQQAAFVDAYVKGGGSATDAARMAGYAAGSERQSAYRLMQLPHIQNAIQDAMRGEIRDLAALAFSRLREILTIPLEKSPVKASTYVDAAKMLADRAGLGPKPGSDGKPDAKPISEMTLAELEAAAAAISSGLKVVHPIQTLEHEPEKPK